MKKLLLLLVLLLLVSHNINAANRTEIQMKEAAFNALVTNQARLNQIGDIKELKEFLSLPSLRIFGYENGGFAVVTTDDSFESVIGVSNFQFADSLPCGFKWWLEIINSNMLKKDETSSRKITKSKNKSVDPLITTDWGQERPFNDNCTFSNGNKKYQCVTGCVATALAQIMNYYRYPECGKGSITYDITYNNDFTITFSENFSQSFYDWDNIIDSYKAYYNNTSVDAHTKAVAKLMKDCGVAINTRFSDSNHGSSSSLIKAENALKNYFNYDSTTKNYLRSDYTKDEWLDIIYQELDKGRPILYSGTEENSMYSSGHAFVINGYDTSGKVYINWGWDGSYDGYYDIDLLNPASQKYNYNQSMVVAIPPTGSNIPSYQIVTISSEGNGCVNYGNLDGRQVRQETLSFKVIEDNDVTLFFTPDVGYQVKKVIINGSDVTASILNNQYSLNNIESPTTVDVVFEKAFGYTDEYNKYITCVGQSISKSLSGSSFVVTIGFSITNSGDDIINITKLVAKDPNSNSTIFTSTDTSVLGEMEGNSSKALSIKMYTDVSTLPNFELEYTLNGKKCVYQSVNYRILTITSNDFGTITFSGISVGSETKKFSIEPGENATLGISPNKDCVLNNLMVNKSDVTSNITNNKYIIKNINTNTSVIATFDSNSEDRPTIDGHEYADLGLQSGSCWSVTNYGAKKPEETGSYVSDYSDYVKSNWGDNWRKPTKEEMQELLDECEWTWTERNGMNGFNIKGPNGKSIFLPAAGKAGILGKSQVGTAAYYLTSSKNGMSTWILSATTSVQTLKSTYISGIDDYPIRPILNIKKEPKVYKLTYIIDGEVYKTYEYKKGEDVTQEPDPEKEGYSFSGWSDVPLTMPDHDVTVTGSFSINEYKLTYKVDGAVYKTYDIEYGAKITPEPAPIKEGYIFSGWSEIPETMPAHDVVVTGTFAINTYAITYKVDDEVYKTDSVTYNSTITPEEEPTKEGYTFSGWSEIPETMPAHDVEITGTFTINKYLLTYKVDGEIVKSDSIVYNTDITPEVEPTKEGYTFSGWSEIPETMPAHDVVVTGTFTINKYKLTYMIDDEVYKVVVYEYGATITPEPKPDGDYNEFEWVGLPEKMPARDVTVYARYTTGIVEVLMTQGIKRIYNTNGKQLGKL